MRVLSLDTSEAMPPETLAPIRKGMDLAVNISGGEAPAVVFAHGGLGNRFNWRLQFEWAQRQSWQALAYALGGHGDSSPYGRCSID